MPQPETTREFEVPRFFDGQRLFAADLQYLADTLRQANELHNRSLHQPGIGQGFAIAGSPGGTTLEIGPGYAIDDVGREIVLTTPHEEQVPAVDAEDEGNAVSFDLTVSYPSAIDLEISETRPGLCGSQGAVRLRIEPMFCWVRLERAPDGSLQPADPQALAAIMQNRQLRLARVAVLHCVVDSLSLAERRSARPPDRPYLRSGRTQVTWSSEIVRSQTGSTNSLFLTAKVDTTPAGFRSTPFYFARIAGERVLHVKLNFPSEETDRDLVSVDGTVSVETAAATGFTVRVLLYWNGANLLSEVSGKPEDAFQDRWSIEWIGLE